MCSITHPCTTHSVLHTYVLATAYALTALPPSLTHLQTSQRFLIPLYAVMHMDTDAFVSELMERLNLKQTGTIFTTLMDDVKAQSVSPRHAVERRCQPNNPNLTFI